MNSRVTPIESLPDIDELENNNILPYEHMEKVQKMIRNSHQPPQEAGMVYYNPKKPQPQQLMNYPQYDMENNNNYFQDPQPQPQLNCIDVAKHIEQCPICSKFYNKDNTIYIVLIIFLTIVTIILLKKVLDV